MVIKDTSWHYRYIKLHGFKKTYNVCLYTRAFLLSMAIDIIILGFVAIFGASTETNGKPLIPLICQPDAHGLLFMTGIYFLYGLLEVLIMQLGCAIIALLCIGVLALFEFLKEKAKGTSKNEAVQSNPLVQYVKDKHNKMCTTITIEKQAK